VGIPTGGLDPVLLQAAQVVPASASVIEGKRAIVIEVTNVTEHGVWLIAAGREQFLPYSKFPWFKHAPVSAIFNVEEPSPGHFHWPDIDVDLGIETIEHPERFPLNYK
jgi:hypothetical protein